MAIRTYTIDAAIPANHLLNAIDSECKVRWSSLYQGFVTDSRKGFESIAFIVDDSIVDSDIDAVVNNHNTILLTADKVTVIADDTDEAAITISHSDNTLDYVVYYEGEIDSTPDTINTTDGTATLLFTADVAGTYLIAVSRQSPNGTTTGYIQIEAT